MTHKLNCNAQSCFEIFVGEYLKLREPDISMRPFFHSHSSKGSSVPSFNDVQGIDRFKKVARLGTSLLISHAITSISATMRGKCASDDFSKWIYRFKDANPDSANSAIARIFSISESTLGGIVKRRIGWSDRQ